MTSFVNFVAENIRYTIKLFDFQEKNANSSETKHMKWKQKKKKPLVTNGVCEAHLSVERWSSTGLQTFGLHLASELGGLPTLQFKCNFQREGKMVCLRKEKRKKAVKVVNFIAIYYYTSIDHDFLSFSQTVVRIMIFFPSATVKKGSS